MVKYILRLLIVAGALLLAERFVDGFTVASFWPTAVLAAFVFGLLNTIIKPIMKILTLPITILTLGLFSLLINVLIFWMLAFFPGIAIDGFMSAVCALVIVTLVSWVADMILK